MRREIKKTNNYETFKESCEATVDIKDEYALTNLALAMLGKGLVEMMIVHLFCLCG